ncbi:sigma-70 family RNA polymerase sigma factor [Romboutsia weinsteinii]|uniref:Sigma-70 family RNA polymerase sigma factor n=1 Tax=Romboutsia weinsteinii TaxID=2020949 RepID=A0A371J3N0_9FIRM|nr:sigma-70 family RNA polymerase sigma factor [Romboutsia weinsteinii]RDY27323.1 sigma-70 family RNA polymerase sigma factor [Romboutsia weinsteinii]
MKINEENFIIQLRKGNEKALEYVIDKYGWIINSIVKKHLYNLQNYQEECINDILIGIWNNIESFDESKNSFKNWVGGISKYKAIDYRRKYLRYINEESIDEMEIRSEKSIFIDITKNELDNEIDNLLNNLKPEDKEIFLKLYIEDKEVDVVSKEMNMKREVIYNRVSRGKDRLRKLFQK